MNDFVCEPLGNQHDRTRFDCGVSVLNDYLAKYAKQDVKRKASAVFVLVKRSDPTRIIGFYTLCATSVGLSELPEELTNKMPRYPEIPAFLLRTTPTRRRTTHNIPKGAIEIESTVVPNFSRLIASIHSDLKFIKEIKTAAIAPPAM